MSEGRIYERCCLCCGLPLADDWRGELCTECASPTESERIMDNELTPEDAEKLAGQAEEQGDIGEDR